MRYAAFIAFLLLSGSVHGASSGVVPQNYSELPPGRYSVDLHGMVTTVCARAIAAEWEKLPEVEKAVVDYDREQAVVTVRLDRTLRVKALRKALRRAEKIANIGARYEMLDVRYIP